MFFRRVIVSVLFALLAMPLAARAQEAEVDPAAAETVDSIDTAREALGDQGRLPWYDPEKDDLRAVNLAPQAKDDFSRDSRWASGPAQPHNVPAVNWGFPSIGTIFYYIMVTIFWIVVIGLVGFLIYLFVKAYLDRETAAAVNTKATASDDLESQQDRIESLPFVMARPRGDLLDEARAQYEAGNFRMAVIFLFSYLLIHLDKHQQIRLAKGKTNRMYLSELRPLPEVRGIVERTMFAFEDVFFGDHSLTRQEFEACWNQLDKFHEHVEQVAV